jgi:hypothetical protein
MKSNENATRIQWIFINHCELTLRERLTYCYLIYHMRWGKGATVAWISRYAGQDWKTTKTHLKRLIEYGYADEHDDHYYAIEAPNLKKRDKLGNSEHPWYAKYTVVELNIPPEGSVMLDRPTTWVLYQLIGKCPNTFAKMQTYRSLGKMLGVSRETLEDALERLSHKKIRADKLHRRGLNLIDIGVVTRDNKRVGIMLSLHETTH